MTRRTRLSKEKVVVNLQSVIVNIPKGLSYNAMMREAQNKIRSKKIRVESVEVF